MVLVGGHRREYGLGKDVRVVLHRLQLLGIRRHARRLRRQTNQVDAGLVLVHRVENNLKKKGNMIIRNRGLIIFYLWKVVKYHSAILETEPWATFLDHYGI